MSIINDIIAETVTRLDRIQTANGYATNVAEVVRPKRHGDYQPKDKQILVEYDNQERVEELDYPGNPPALAWRLPIMISCVVMPSETDNRSWDEIAAEFATDAQRAITADVHWYQFAGVAFNAEISPLERLEPDDDSPAGNRFYVYPVYRTSENNPNAAR